MYVEFSLSCVFPYRLMIINDLAVGVGEAEGPQVAGLESIDTIGRILGDIPTIENRIVHHHEAAAAARLRLGGNPHGVEHVEMTVSTEGRGRPHRTNDHDRLV